ncbi:ABC transporter permease subunit [Pseudooceanicola sp. GBMRC 2024]|uniref:ABC transporter permease subunit n=1 Tax=Pseudooceanicola albus TaxID=2692189 RepID=A0A6L7G357_9RHOB|nr:ABC transporter permease subunit [Pseudooceanicola albus]MXN17866.1 ABC transporter permease subunit [Pseudooceanicola albus]
MIALWQHQKIRNALLQAAFVGGLLGLILTGALTAHHTLAAQGILSGWDFLWKATGWDMTFALLPATSSDPYWWFLLMGGLNTLFLGTIGLALATLVGILVGLARISENKAARLLGTLYLEIFRNIPLIVQVFFWYALANRLPAPRQAIEVFGALLSNRGLYVPGLNIAGWAIAGSLALLAAGLGLGLWFSLARRFRRDAPYRRRRRAWGTALLAVILAALTLALGHGMGTPWITAPALRGLNIRGGYRIQPEVYTLAFSIAIYGGAYIGEIVRGGFIAVGRGQDEAAKSLGLTRWQSFTRIRLPLAIRAMLPILTNQYVWLIKATTLGITVGYADFFMVVSASITHSGQTLELIGILMLGFLVLNFSLAAGMNRINRAIALKGHQNRS